jgi:hypothetical protein
MSIGASSRTVLVIPLEERPGAIGASIGQRPSEWLKDHSDVILSNRAFGWAVISRFYHGANALVVNTKIAHRMQYYLCKMQSNDG